MQIAADGAVTLTPVKVVPLAHAVQEELAVYKVDTVAHAAVPAISHSTALRCRAGSIVG